LNFSPSLIQDHIKTHKKQGPHRRQKLSNILNVSQQIHADAKKRREELMDKAALNLPRCNLPYTIYGHPSMKDLLMKLGDYRARTSSTEYSQLIDRMTKRKVMVSRIQDIASKFKKVGYIFYKIR